MRGRRCVLSSARMSGTLVYIIIVVASAIGRGMYQVYQKKQAQLEAERVQREREQAILRTGRDPAAEMPRTQQIDPGRQREAELMAQRQEALRQLRQQQAEAEVSGNGGTVRRQLWPGGPVVEIRGAAPAAGPSAQQRPVQRPQPRQQPEFRPPPQMLPANRQAPPPQRQGQVQQGRSAQKRRGPQQQSQQQTLAQAREDSGYAQRERTLARMQASTTRDEAAVPVRPVFGVPSTHDQWRAALIASEIFGPPVSLRAPGTHL